MKGCFQGMAVTIMKKTFQRLSPKIITFKNYKKNIFHAFLFNIRNYSPDVINIQRCIAELNIILPKVNNFDIKQKRHGIFILLYGANTKQDLGR